MFNVGGTPSGLECQNLRYPASVLRSCEQEISNEYWCFPGLNPEGSDEMTKESYLKLNRKLHLALVSCGLLMGELLIVAGLIPGASLVHCLKPSNSPQPPSCCTSSQGNR